MEQNLCEKEMSFGLIVNLEISISGSLVQLNLNSFETSSGK